MTPKKLLLIIVFLSLSLIAAIILIFRTTSFFGKATTKNNSPISLENSYLFSSPLQAKADSKEQIRVVVYLLDGRGLGVANQKVKLITPGTVLINDIQSTSDETGKAVFDISTLTPNKMTISAEVNGSELPQKVNVVFY